MAFRDVVNGRFIENLNDAERHAEGRAPFHILDNAYDLSYNKFVRIFRLNKEMVQEIVEIVRERTVQPSRSSALNAEVKVLKTLRFLATGSYQMDVGGNIKFAISQPSVSRCITEVTNILNHNDVFNNWVHFPKNLEELKTIREKFYPRHGMPGVIGCIDGTHVALIAPPVGDEEYPEHIFVDRKGYYSINVQLICDSDMRILNVNAKYPGNAHDSFIWENSNVLPVMRELHRRGHTNYLSGDSGYSFRPWLHVPVENAEPGTREDLYNQCHKRIRATIERCNGVLKARFRCLLKHRVLHYSPTKASKIINTCAVLHNMCIHHQLADPPRGEDEDDIAEEEIDFGMYEDDPQDNEFHEARARVDPELAEARRLRQRIIQNFFFDRNNV